MELVIVDEGEIKLKEDQSRGTFIVLFMVINKGKLLKYHF